MINNSKKYIYLGVFLIVFGMGIFFVSSSMYNKTQKDDNSKESIEDAKITSKQESKTINEVLSEENALVENTAEDIFAEKEETKEIKNNSINTNASDVEKQKNELQFIMPLEGNISKNFSKENLVYSDTLEEWISHLGIDIVGDRGTEVKASESGKIFSIKNDPRYGLTVIIEHDDGYRTLYANLDNIAEACEEGNEVNKGQVIGYIGVSGSFECLDEAHLHFEVLRDDENINPLDLFTID